MLKVFHSFQLLDFDQLCAVYGNEGDYTKQRNDLYDYLHEDFFRVSGAFYAVWELQGLYVSALRMEPYRDGYLIEALETLPRERGKGYAKSLLNGVLYSGEVSDGLPVYSHVRKKNSASLAVHTACGFEPILDHAVFIDGSVYHHSRTLRWTR